MHRTPLTILLLSILQDAFLGREDALTTTDSQANLSELQTSVQEEVEAQLEAS